MRGCRRDTSNDRNNSAVFLEVTGTEVMTLANDAPFTKRITLERVDAGEPIAIAVTDIPAGGTAMIDLGTRTAWKRPDVAQLGVPGCHCGCSDGKRGGA